MMTFSINTGTTTQTSVLNIIGATSVDLSPVLNKLYDNTDKEIDPEDIRDSVFTSYSTSAFKKTKAQGSSVNYIGIDNGNTDITNKDIKNKIFLGKRTFSSSDILDVDLLNSDGDIFIYNTKKDTISNFRTRISILGGKDSNLHESSPYVQSQVVTSGTYSSLSLDLVNKNEINLKSLQGTVSINGIAFPKISDSTTDASNNKVLKWENDEMIWESLTYSADDYIGVTGSELNIYGSEVNLNGYSLEFSDNKQCTVEIGDIKFGEKFNSVPLSEMLRRIIYTYLPPQCGLKVLPPYQLGCAEIGSSPKVVLEYKIIKRSLPTLNTTLSNMIPSSYPPITQPGQVVMSATASGFILTPITSATSSFSVIVNDGTQSCTSTSTIRGIYPYFYGFINNNLTISELLNLSKIIEPQSDKAVDIFGSGDLYFIYDNNYPDLSDIIDEFGNNWFSDFTLSISTLSSPEGLWASKQFKIYKAENVPQIGPPSVRFYFKY